MKFKTAIWKALTLFVVLLLILNPETIALALFIDTIGLDIFILLIELQIANLFWIFIQLHIKPTLSFLRSLKLNHHNALLAMQGPSGIMHLLVASSTLPLVISHLA